MLSLKFNKVQFTQRYHTGVSLFFVSLLLAALLFTACFVSVFSGFSPFVSGANVTVSDQNALRAAVAGAPSWLGTSYVIALGTDISLTELLIIPAGKNITLTSNGDGFFKLIGATQKFAIFVEGHGFLILDGIIVTHLGAVGSGVEIGPGGTLVMFDGEISGNGGDGVHNNRGSFSLFGGVIYGNMGAQFGGGVSIFFGSFMMFGGEISGNTVWNSGGGVYNCEGTFEMYGGIISNNTAPSSGGVVNSFGDFRLYDGVIANNVATQFGGGVCNFGSFEMFGGTIFNNTDKGDGGGGVYNWGTFNLFDGAIVNNTASTWGGGVLNMGHFSLMGGVISNNTAAGLGGGVYIHNDKVVVMSGGEIFGNTAIHGGGVYNERGIFKLSGGEIYNNTAYGFYGSSGGGVYICYGIFTMFGGVIANNTAINDGGGVYNTLIFELFGGVIANNTAIYGGGVCSSYSSGVFTMSGDGVISNNTAVYGGGVYIGNTDHYTSGIFNMTGGSIVNNLATSDGGGVYINSGVFNVTRGRISGNVASNNGGGIWVAVENLDKLYVADGVLFSKNAASVAYNRNPDHDAVYNSNIGSKVTWSEPFTQGYNNYDISYTSGTQYSPEPSNPAPSETTPPTPTNTIIVDHSTNNSALWIIVAITLDVIAIIIIAAVFAQKKHKT